MPSPLTHDDPQAFGPFRPIARLGSGGMGTVYLARSVGGRTVALKTMHAGIASDPTSRARFQLEADAARVVGDRYGAGVVDADVRAQIPWLATEYVLGPPLDNAVELCGPLSEASVRALGAALCGALDQLHRSDVVHRDLKPSNVLVTAYGPKVIDFGIARAIGDDRLTSTGSAVGTPAFMSPEQASGQEHTSAGDVFALAGVLVFAATGHGPFGQGQAADLLYRVRYADPDLGDVPAALVPVLAQCLDKNPFRRLTTAHLAAQLHDGTGEFADHLPDALLADIARRATEVWHIAPERLPAPPQQADTPTASPAKLSRRRLLLAGGGAALVTAAAGAAAWAWNERGGSEGQTQPAPGPSNSQLPRKKLDSTWQIQVGNPPMELIKATPLVVDDLVTVMADSGLAGVEAKTGHVRWTSDQVLLSWHVTTDGQRLVRLVQPDGAEGPLLLTSVDLVTGKASEPFAHFTDFNGAIYENHLVCTAEDVVYLVAGEGDASDDGFLASQSWSLCAVDIRKGRRLWTTPLPARRSGTARLHLLTARIVDNRLVALQEANDGSVHVVVRDTRTGSVRWQRALDGVSPERMRRPLATDEQHLYLGAGRLQALRLSDGALAWDSESKRPGRTYGLPNVKDSTVYVVEKGLGLVTFDAQTGQPKWQEKGGQGAKADLTAAPVIGTDYAYSKRSSELWEIDLSSRMPSRSYKTTGDRFIAHEKAKTTITLGGKFLAAFPLR
ncbi:protein kinase domain-containing protein [Streptomyces sp. YIM S03343]